MRFNEMLQHRLRRFQNTAKKRYFLGKFNLLIKQLLIFNFIRKLLLIHVVIISSFSIYLKRERNK